MADEQLRFCTKTALALVFPPLQFIQEIRKNHDNAVDRWMPHINLIFPFVEPESFEDMVERLQVVCAKFKPFEVDLGELGTFVRKRVNFHLQVKKGLGQMAALFKAIVTAMPDVQVKHAEFTPHLTLGQCSKQQFADLEPELKAAVADEDLEFTIDHVYIIQRNDTDPFEVVHKIPLTKED